MRAHIENQLLELEAGDGISMEDNPDNHFIISEYERTLLTPNCEIIVEDIIFLSGEYQDVFITDLDFERLEETKKLWKQYGETEGTVKAVQQGLAEPNTLSLQKTSGENPCPALCQALHPEYKLLSSLKECPYKYQFTIHNSFAGRCSCIINGSSNIKWDFGDGNTKNGTTVTHEYKKDGTYYVTVIIPLYDGINGSDWSCRKTLTLKIESCEVTINTPVKDTE